MPRQRGGALHEEYMNRFYELLHEARVRAPRLVGLWLNILLDEDSPRIKRRFRGLDRYIEQMILKYPAYSARALNNLVRKQRQMGLNAEHVVRARIRMVKAKTPVSGLPPGQESLACGGCAMDWTGRGCASIAECR
ncbi:MAG: hypothetical protein IPL14_19450 [Nitrospira sp.]|nr:hypothetical protein [Nitrospira sp.]